MRPESAALGWALPLGCLVVGEFGTLLHLPAVLIGMPPFEHGFSVPGDQLDVGPLVVVLGVAAVMLVAANAAYQRRDVR